MDIYTYVTTSLTLIWVCLCWCNLPLFIFPAVTLAFATFGNIVLERTVPNLIFKIHPSLQLLGKTQARVFPISGFLGSPL